MPPISVVQEITAPDGRAHWVTADGFIVRVVGRPHLTAIKEDSEGFANTWATHDDFEATEERVQFYEQAPVPTAGQMKYICRIFFNAHDGHETFLWYGKMKKTGELAFYAPKQKVQVAHVDVDEEDAMAEFAKVARILGDIHSHPWNGQPSMSNTDDTDMKESSGIHGIVSNDYHVSWYGSARGVVGELFKTSVKKASEVRSLLLLPPGIRRIKDVFVHETTEVRGYKPYAFQSNKVPKHYQEAGFGPLKGQRKKHNKPDFSHNVLDDEEWWDLLQTSEGDEDHNPDLSPELASLLDSAGIEITAASHAYVIEIVTPQGLKVPYLFRAKDWWLIADEVRELYGPQVVVSVANAIKGF